MGARRQFTIDLLQRGSIETCWERGGERVGRSRKKGDREMEMRERRVEAGQADPVSGQ
jgi:hypothetical protein